MITMTHIHGVSKITVMECEREGTYWTLFTFWSHDGKAVHEVMAFGTDQCPELEESHER